MAIFDAKDLFGGHHFSRHRPGKWGSCQNPLTWCFSEMRVDGPQSIVYASVLMIFQSQQ